MSDLRKKNGHEKPWKIKFFGLGNEAWGCGGDITPEYYANEYRRFASYTRNFGGNQLFRIASGADASRPDRHLDWTETFIKNIPPGSCKVFRFTITQLIGQIKALPNNFQVLIILSL